LGQGKAAKRESERGAVAISAALLLVVLLGFFALAFDTGLLMDTRGELQNGSDAAALAAAHSLDGTASGLTAARQSAYAYSLQHTAYDQAITIDASADVIFGAWHMSAAECLFGSSGADCFEPLSTSDPHKITAVKIRNGRDGGSHNPPLNLPFGHFVGATTASVRSAAVAVGGGPAATGCALPFAVAECSIVDPGTGLMNCASGPTQLVFTNANADGIGFANLYYPNDTQAPNSGFVADAIANRTCNPNNFQIGPAKIQNGNDFNDTVTDALLGVDKKGGVVGPCLLGQTMSWAVIDAGCPSNPTFQGVEDVVGFVKATIAAVTDNQGNSLGCPGTTAPPVAGSPKNAMIVDFPCDVPGDPGGFGGGRVFNTTGVQIRLVQ
jgi:hypothetical protein